MSHRAFVAASAVVIFSVAIAAQPSLMLDQQAPPEDPPGSGITTAVGGLYEQVVSQTVTVGIAGRLRAVEVPIGCGSGTLVLEIRDVNADGTPGPTVLSSETYAATDFPAPVTEAFRRLRIRGMTARFDVGETFAISLGNIGGSCGIWRGPIGDPYSGGTGWTDATDGPIVPLSLGTDRDDMPFRTFVQ